MRDNKLLGTDPRCGLTRDEAKRRLRLVGPNEVSTSRPQSRLRQTAKLLSDPMGLMLLGLAVLYAILGDHTDAMILLIAYIPVTAVDVILELRSNSALAALRATLRPVAKVLRDRKSWDVPIREIVPGDILIFEEGQSLPADGSLIEAEHVTINEAALTGESVPVEKETRQPFFGGTQLLTGRALGLVEKTGRNSRFGAISILLESVEAGKSPLKRQVDWLVKRVLVVAAVLVLFLLSLELFRTGLFIPSLIVALTLGMAAVPEEFPLALLESWSLETF